ncbi:hypothetical protein MN116_006736 [Schistosoma mekongi]|uniref:B box-type domain-containing protein n=1 Tax=Schistosoma mekongi TaxID=38744 RepID=A0AAE1Z7V3_SCHME|nr:hypothetical protein MN116_006736 [Schistosoma mekongi]
MDCGNGFKRNLEQASESLVCSVCSAREVFGILPACLHVACVTCAEYMRKDDVYCCLLCKESSPKIISNPNICNTENTNKSPTCNWCHDNGEQTKSIGHCEDCDIWLCGECLKGHNRMPPLRNHNITLLSKSEHLGSLRCEAHPNEALECFCEACGVLTCRDCQLSVHRDHGSHRWVGEKAVQLRAPLEERIQNLKELREKLSSALHCATSARTCVEDSFIFTVEKARRDIKTRTSSLINCIQNRSECLLNELNKKADMYVGRLQETEDLILKLQEQINFASAFSNHLIRNMDNDPASLVQLYDTVTLRLDLLQLLSEQVLNGSSSIIDSVDQKLKDRIKESNLWSENIVGWRTMVNTRALFLGTWDAEELCRYSGTIAWLPKQAKTTFSHNDNSQVPIKVENGLSKTVDHTCNQLSSDTNDFLDSLAELDGNNWTCGDTNRESSSSPVGCAICFGVGLLAHCGRCNRAYHLDCHLPRINSISLTPNWVCGLCADEEVLLAAHADQSVNGRFPRSDYLAGCRILMGLLVHNEAVHFTASVCPACSVPLLSSSQSTPHCPSGHLYHRLAELRLYLEEAASSPNSCNSDKNQCRFTCLSDWLVEVDKFWSDAAKETDIHGSTKGCLQAARRLRSRLNSLVREYRPDCEAVLSSKSIDTGLVNEQLSSIPSDADDYTSEPYALTTSPVLLKTEVNE